MPVSKIVHLRRALQSVFKLSSSTNCSQQLQLLAFAQPAARRLAYDTPLHGPAQWFSKSLPFNTQRL
jgi:hypothetical protein